MADFKLENNVLKELLKKTHQLWLKDWKWLKYLLIKDIICKKLFNMHQFQAQHDTAKNNMKKRRKKNNPGRPVPGYTINPDGSIITDELIVSALEQ